MMQSLHPCVSLTRAICSEMRYVSMGNGLVLVILTHWLPMGLNYLWLGVQWWQSSWGSVRFWCSNTSMKKMKWHQKNSIYKVLPLNIYLQKLSWHYWEWFFPKSIIIFSGKHGQVVMMWTCISHVHPNSIGGTHFKLVEKLVLEKSKSSLILFYFKEKIKQERKP